MNKILASILGVFGLAIIAKGKSAQAATHIELPLDSLYAKYGRSANLDWKLLKAIAIVESSENPKAINPADPSYGLGQVLCTTNGQSKFCTNKLPAVKDFYGMTTDGLLDAETNIKIYSQILKWNIENYGLEKGIAVYNRWLARNENPPFTNQEYVDKVLKIYRSL